MSRVGALLPYTAAFTAALSNQYREKIERSMITNPTCVKMRNFRAAYRRFGPPHKPISEKNGMMTRSQKTANGRRWRAMKRPPSVILRNRKRAEEDCARSARGH